MTKKNSVLMRQCTSQNCHFNTFEVVQANKISRRVFCPQCGSPLQEISAMEYNPCQAVMGASDDASCNCPA